MGATVSISDFIRPTGVPYYNMSILQYGHVAASFRGLKASVFRDVTQKVVRSPTFGYSLWITECGFVVVLS